MTTTRGLLIKDALKDYFNAMTCFEKTLNEIGLDEIDAMNMIVEFNKFKARFNEAVATKDTDEQTHTE